MVEVLTESELRQCVDVDAEGLAAIEDGFARLGRGEVTIPPIMGLEIPEKNGAADVKAAYVSGWDSFAIKLSTRFFNNPSRGLSSGSGLMALLDADTGKPRAVLLDNGYLTTVRTALAGALAAKWLAPERVARVAVLGAGSQARWQVRALGLVRRIESIRVFARSTDAVSRYCETMATQTGVPVTGADSAREAVRDADIIITTTPATEPLFPVDAVPEGAHVTAMGSDAGHKNELPPGLLARADVLACDVRSQCLERGEMRHAVAAGVIQESSDIRELGAIINGTAAGREHAGQLTVCDLTGVGVQDTAIARLAVRKAAEAGYHRALE